VSGTEYEEPERGPADEAKFDQARAAFSELAADLGLRVLDWPHMDGDVLDRLGPAVAIALLAGEAAAKGRLVSVLAIPMPSGGLAVRPVVVGR
jgi:hypothetical protein